MFSMEKRGKVFPQDNEMIFIKYIYTNVKRFLSGLKKETYTINHGYTYNFN